MMFLLIIDFYFEFTHQVNQQEEYYQPWNDEDDMHEGFEKGKLIQPIAYTPPYN